MIFLAVPPSQMFQMSCSNFSTICYVLIIFCKTIFFQAEKDPQTDTELQINKTTKSDEKLNNHTVVSTDHGPGIRWDIILAAQEEEFNHIVNALYVKFAALAVALTPENGNHDANPMWHFSMFIKRILTGYERHIKSRHSSSTEQDPGLSHLNMSNKGDFTRNVPSISMAPNSLQDTITSNMNSGMVQFNSNLIGTDSTPIPFGMDTNILPGWDEDIAWEAMLNEIMFMPFQSK